MEQKKEQQIQHLLGLLNQCQHLKDLSSMNVGSYHKTKDEIVEQTCEIARNGIEYQALIISAINWLWFSDYSFEDFISHQVNESERNNQPKADRDAKRLVLDKLAEEIISI